MKKKFLFAILVFLTFVMSVKVSGAVTGLKVSDGDETMVFFLEDIPEVSLNGDAVIIKSTKEKIEYSSDSPISFEFIDASKVKNITGVFQEIHITPSTIKISGLKAHEEVAIYHTNGQIAKLDNANTEGFWEISKSSLPHGVFILKTKYKSYKIIIR